jgi:hypothetical protein
MQPASRTSSRKRRHKTCGAWTSCYKNVMKEGINVQRYLLVKLVPKFAQAEARKSVTWPKTEGSKKL